MAHAKKTDLMQPSFVSSTELLFESNNTLVKQSKVKYLVGYLVFFFFLQRAECCSGFYGPNCKPCIGGFQHPCYDKGKVSTVCLS